ncbi:MAG TPA: hypothetical protein VJH55_03490 [Candidatus Paceibacterota bacterium]
MESLPQIDIEYIFFKVYEFFAEYTFAFWPEYLTRFVTKFYGLSTVLTLFFIGGIVYTMVRVSQVEKLEEQKFDAKVVPAYDADTSVDPAMARKWETILQHVDSVNPNDWKLAIIEADIMLGDMLTRMGYKGESIGEKLKGIERSDFTTIESAWEAHKVRNAIAHQGSDFMMNEREAKRIINLYRTVFEEFYYI